MIKLSDVKIHRLGTKTGLIGLLLILGILLGESVFSWSHSRNELNKSFEAESDSLTLASAEAMNLPLWDFDVETLQIMTASLAQNPNVISVIVQDAAGRTIAEKNNLTVDVVQSFEVQKVIKAAYERHSSTLGTLSMNFSRASIQKELRYKAFISAARGLISGFLLFIVMFWIIRSLVKPIEALESIISEYDGRNFVDYVPGEDREDELGSLAQGFKRMASQIHENFSTLEERVAERTEELNEAVIKTSAANKAKTEFLANMSHEIRTPLNGVLGMLDVLRRTPLTEKQLYYTDIINKSGNNLLTILSDILNLSKIEAGKETFHRAPCNLQNIIQETVSLFAASASEKKLDLNFSYETNLPKYFVTDCNKIRQILSNLIGNAIKFTPKGRVTVNVTGKTERDYTSVVISVEDTGIGIEKDKLDAIFEKFNQAENSTTRRYGGTGLGLTISRKLAQGLGGEIRVTSKTGQGTTFSIHLPLQVTEKPALDNFEKPCPVNDTNYPILKPKFASAQSDLPSKSSGAKFNFLVVEDDHFNIEVIKNFLEHPKIEITVAENGLQAVNLHQSGVFDVIFMDVSMPVMDGLKATQIIRKNEAKADRDRTPIICLTAHVMEKDREKFLNSGMDDYLPKPLNRKELLTVTLKWLKIVKEQKLEGQVMKERVA